MIDTYNMLVSEWVGEQIAVVYAMLCSSGVHTIADPYLSSEREPVLTRPPSDISVSPQPPTLSPLYAPPGGDPQEVGEAREQGVQRAATPPQRQHGAATEPGG